MPGSMTSGVPDYQDSDAEARGLLGSRKRADREKGKELLQLMEQRQNRDTRDREFNERQADTRARDVDRQSEAKYKQDQLNLYREQLSEARNNRGEDVRSAHLNTLLADPNTKPEIRSAIENHLLKAAGVSATVPVDPKVAALARSRGLPEPQPTVLGGGGQTQSAPTTDSRPMSPRGDIALNVDAGKVYGQPHPQGTDINTNTGEFVPSNLVGTINGRPATDVIAEGALKTGVSPEDTRSRGVYDRLLNDRSQTMAKENATSVASNVGQGVGGPLHTTQTPPTAEFSPSALADESRPDIKGTERPGLETVKNLIGKSNELGNIGQSMEPFTIAKNALGGLFSGGQGGANEIVKQPTNQPTPNPTPAPGTQFQGPVTAAASFAGAPLAPTPVPANTPPAIPPVNKPTPEEERRRMALQQ